MIRRIVAFGLPAAILLAGAAGWHAAPKRTGLKVIVIGLDGANTAVMSPLLEAGRLPNLARFLRKAAGGHLDSPVNEGWTSPALWTTIVTGVAPPAHGITDFVLPQIHSDGTRGKLVAATSGHRHAKAIWNLLDESGLRPAIVGLWATEPAEHVNGAIVSDHVTYSRMRETREFRDENGGSVDFHYATTLSSIHPAVLAPQVARRVLLPRDVEPERLKSFADFSDDEVARILAADYSGGFNTGGDRFQELKFTLQSDRSYEAIAHLVDRAVAPDFTMLYLEGIDVIEHAFWAARAELAGHDDPADHGRFRQVVDRYYETTDALIAPWLSLASERTVVIVVSDHGFATVPTHEAGAWHDRNAIFFAAGGPFVPGATIASQGTIADVTPTLLALFGLPKGDDMPGRVLVELLAPRFIAAHPPESIPTWGPRGVVWQDTAPSEEDQDIVERLKQMPYLQGVDPSQLAAPRRQP